MPSATPAPTLESALQRPRKAVSSGWGSLDSALFAGEKGLGLTGTAARIAPELSQEGPAGLVRGGVHEWFGTGSLAGSPQEVRSQGAWEPPLFLLRHLAGRAVLDASERGEPTHALWIGRSVWPYPRTLNGGVDLVEVARPLASSRASSLLGFDLELCEVPERFSLADGLLFEHSLFVDPGSGPARAGQRLWAIDAALRCPSVTTIVADGSGLPMAGTRRLQLAAAAANVLVLLARPPAEIREVSAATTRWTVSRGQSPTAEGTELQSDTAAPCWRVELLRAKGSQGIR